MLSLKELAKELRLSENTVRRAIKAGRIKAVKLGKQFRISEAEVERIKKEGY